MSRFSGTEATRSLTSLVGELVASGYLRSESLISAFGAVDRLRFVPKERRAPQLAYLDSPLPIGCNVTISAPSMHAIMLEHVAQHFGGDLTGKRVLDVGSGTGIVCAYFAHCVGPTGAVFGVDHAPALVEASLENLRQAGDPLREWLASRRITIHVGDGRNGLPGAAPFDVVHVGAAASTVHDALTAQLAPGGCMVIPVDADDGTVQDLCVITKSAEGALHTARVSQCRFVPLTDLDAQLTG